MLPYSRAERMFMNNTLNFMLVLKLLYFPDFGQKTEGGSNAVNVSCDITFGVTWAEIVFLLDILKCP